MSVQLGDVTATVDTIDTPAWSAPIAGTQVWLADHSTVVRRIPFWAVLFAVVFFPLGLLLLLIREPAYGGYMQVNIVNGDQTYLTTVPTRTFGAVSEVYSLANAIRQFAK